MPAHARGGHTVTVGTRACQETRRAPLRDLVRHVRVPAARVDQLGQLPGLIRQRPRAERLLDRGTLPRGQGLGGLLLPRPRGRLLGGGGGRVWAYRHALPATPGSFPAPHASHTGVVSPRTPSRPRCYDMGRYLVPWLLYGVRPISLRDMGPPS